VVLSAHELANAGERPRGLMPQPPAGFLASEDDGLASSRAHHVVYANVVLEADIPNDGSPDLRTHRRQPENVPAGGFQRTDGRQVAKHRLGPDERQDGRAMLRFPEPRSDSPVMGAENGNMRCHRISSLNSTLG